MIYLKESPVGIDKEIQNIQEYLYNKLNWNIDAYGRAEIDEKEPIVFVKKNDYKKVLFINPKTHGKMFFIDNETTKYTQPFSRTDVDVIFLLNIKNIKPQIAHRADEEVRIEILKHLQKKFKEITIVKGIESLNGFNTDLENLQPYHFLKFSFEVKYQNINTINC